MKLGVAGLGLIARPPRIAPGAVELIGATIKLRESVVASVFRGRARVGRVCILPASTYRVRSVYEGRLDLEELGETVTLRGIRADLTGRILLHVPVDAVKVLTT